MPGARRLLLPHLEQQRLGPDTLSYHARPQPVAQFEELDYDEAPDAVRDWLEAGADTIDLVLPLGLPEEQVREMLEAGAPAATSSPGGPRTAAIPRPRPTPRVTSRVQSKAEAARP
jgi:hypothetical protein